MADLQGIKVGCVEQNDDWYLISTMCDRYSFAEKERPISKITHNFDFRSQLTLKSVKEVLG